MNDEKLCMICPKCADLGATRITKENWGRMELDTGTLCYTHGEPMLKVQDFRRLRSFLLNPPKDSGAFVTWYGLCLDFIQKYSGEGLIKAIDKIERDQPKKGYQQKEETIAFSRVAEALNR